MTKTQPSVRVYFVLIREEDSRYRAEDGTYVLKMSQAQHFPTESQAEAHRNLFTEFVVGVSDPKEKYES